MNLLVLEFLPGRASERNVEESAIFESEVDVNAIDHQLLATTIPSSLVVYFDSMEPKLVRIEKRLGLLRTVIPRRCADPQKNRAQSRMLVGRDCRDNGKTAPAVIIREVSTHGRRHICHGLHLPPDTADDLVICARINHSSGHTTTGAHIGLAGPCPACSLVLPVQTGLSGRCGSRVLGSGLTIVVIIISNGDVIMRILDTDPDGLRSILCPRHNSLCPAGLASLSLAVAAVSIVGAPFATLLAISALPHLGKVVGRSRTSFLVVERSPIQKVSPQFFRLNTRKQMLRKEWDRHLRLGCCCGAFVRLVLATTTRPFGCRLARTNQKSLLPLSNLVDTRLESGVLVTGELLDNNVVVRVCDTGQEGFSLRR